MRLLSRKDFRDYSSLKTSLNLLLRDLETTYTKSLFKKEKLFIITFITMTVGNEEVTTSHVV